MKEATGEANMTVVTIVLITIVAAVATPLIRGLLNGSAEKACCSSYGGVYKNGSCSVEGDTGYQKCVAGAKNANTDN